MGEVAFGPFVWYRRIASLLLLLYFFFRIQEFWLYTSELGCLDHEAIQTCFWWSTPTIFSWVGEDSLRLALLLLGAVGVFCCLIGRVGRWAAIVSLFIVSQHGRWNFAILSIDDTSAMLFLLWLILLPCWPGDEEVNDWGEKVVPAKFQGAIWLHLVLYYLVVGLTKWTSDLWMTGQALEVVMRMPIANLYEAWPSEPTWFEIWRWLNDLTLWFEPFFPFCILLTRGSFLRRCSLVGWSVFHVGISTCVGLPIANLGLAITPLLVACDEWVLHGEKERESSVSWGHQQRWILLLFFTFVCTLAMSKRVPGFKPVHQAGMAALYVAGIPQEYHLFDWIDTYNYSSKFQVEVYQNGEWSEGTKPFYPKGVRGYLMESYNYPILWMYIHPSMRGIWREKSLRRVFLYHTQFYPRAEKIRVHLKLTRLFPEDKKELVRDEVLVEGFRDKRGGWSFEETF